MAESVAAGVRSAAVCGGCAREFHPDLTAAAVFCPECGSCLLSLHAGGHHPFVPPRITEEAAWERLRAALIDADRATLTAARLLYLPFHEWPGDLNRRGVVKDARAVLAPAADLLPAGLRPPSSPAANDLRGLAISEIAHKGRLADPRETLDLIRRGEAVDVMIDPPVRPPEGAAAGSEPRLLYYPFWFLTYRVDYKERRDVVDAATGRPVGSSSAPDRWRPAAGGTAAGAAVTFAAVFLAGALHLPIAGSVAAATASWLAAFVVFARLMRRERGR